MVHALTLSMRSPQKFNFALNFVPTLRLSRPFDSDASYTANVFICSKYVHPSSIEVRQTKTGKIAYVCFPRHLRPRLYPTACMTDLQPVVLVVDCVVPRQLHFHQHATHACLLPNSPEHTSLNASLPRMHCSSMPPFQRILAAFQPCSFGRKASTHTMFYITCIWCCLQLLHPTDSPCLQLPLCNEQPAFFRLVHEHSNAAASPVAALHIQFMPSTTPVENALSPPEHVQHPVALSASHVTEHVQHPAAQSASHAPSMCNAMSHVMHRAGTASCCTFSLTRAIAAPCCDVSLQHPSFPWLLCLPTACTLQLCVVLPYQQFWHNPHYPFTREMSPATCQKLDTLSWSPMLSEFLPATQHDMQQPPCSQPPCSLPNAVISLSDLQSMLFHLTDLMPPCPLASCLLEI
jgi:hypothetical protein